MIKILSSQIADSIDIKQLKAAYEGKLLHFGSDELFFEVSGSDYIYVFRYGVVAFTNPNEARIKTFLDSISPYCKNFSDYKLTEEFDVEINAPENKFGYNKIELINSGVDEIRIVMLNVSQSVALDYYSDELERLVKETNNHTQFLEKKGKLDISGRKLNKFIGKAINLRNKINENLYIFDSVPETWENEGLYRIDMELKKTFDLQSRYRNIQEELEIIKENLSLLIDLMHQKRSSLLEIVVILLIMVEVVNLLIEKFI